MTPEQFTYWLQGFAEVNQQPPTKEQWIIIKDHLQLLFKKETPVRVEEPIQEADWFKKIGHKGTSSFPPQDSVIC